MPKPPNSSLIALFSNALSGQTLRDNLLALIPNSNVLLITQTAELIPEILTGNIDMLLIDIEHSPENVAELLILDSKSHLLPNELPILVLCQPESVDKRNIMLGLGANDYINLPFEDSEVTIRIKNAQTIRHLFKTHQTVQDNLANEVKIRTAKLNLLIDSGLLMAVEKNREKLLMHILQEGQKLLQCDGGTLYLVTKQNTLRFTLRTRQDILPFEELNLLDPLTQQANTKYVSCFAAHYKKTILIDDVYQERRFDFSGTRSFDAQTGYKTVSLLTVPMAPRNGQTIGVLQFINALDPQSGKPIPFPVDVLPLIEALAAQAAVALDNLKLIEGQKSSTENIIRALAAAIDTKSPHTGHHCVRVPDLAVMLAEAACKETEGPLADFTFESDDQWLEFRVGAWLHDCGKITTPEYVIEKATKLDMFYNRIHEIRMRFEVLLRDAEILRLENLLNGLDIAAANHQFEQQKNQLFDDFAFLAECNMGREGMDYADLERIQQLAEKVWFRHFDDEVGLSQQDTMRLASHPKPTLPVKESLLADKPKHIIPRTNPQAPDPALGIKMEMPEHLYNHGEIYNLSIHKGTLSREDRYKINEHIIETINLLEKVPFPDFLKRVPEYATTHHETLDGRGYPRQLTETDLSIPARIMAVADIFEAITASDRPYKKPYTLSESLKILCNMKDNRHIDAAVFELFLTSGVYMRFAQKYLLPEQIDDVNILDFLTPNLS
jgi:HD-GYP domain-containing protein (c-di-GMP phosphodiesterase class II)